MSIFIGKSLFFGSEGTYNFFESQLIFQNQTEIETFDDNQNLTRYVKQAVATTFRTISQQYYHAAMHHIGSFIAEKFFLGESKNDAIITTCKDKFFIRDDTEVSELFYTWQNVAISLAGPLFDIAMSIAEIAFVYYFAQFLTLPVAITIGFTASVWIVVELAIASKKLYQAAVASGLIKS